MGVISECDNQAELSRPMFYTMALTSDELDLTYYNMVSCFKGCCPLGDTSGLWHRRGMCYIWFHMAMHFMLTYISIVHRTSSSSHIHLACIIDVAHENAIVLCKYVSSSDWNSQSTIFKTNNII